ncbi:FAD binding domain-containing protein [Streptomyces sp. NPDC056165]|uniref:FAD binding domain-containing protein n=1 Tax=Streptomyces sp. NPDC056165 TaxID=3345733 RepID=UPI0035D6C6DB
MRFCSPRSWAEALELKAERPDAMPIMGGTDVMVEVNAGRLRPDLLLDLTGVADLRSWSVTEPPDLADGGAGSPPVVQLSAGVTYTRVIDELSAVLPGLAAAGRTVGSPQIRNRATVAGNVATASPAGDGLVPLVASRAVVEVASVHGSRRVPVADFMTAPKRTVLRPDELVAAVLVPTRTGPQKFAKIGSRNAMVISVTGFAVELRAARQEVGTGIGSAAATVRPATAAEDFAAAELDWAGRGPVNEETLREFGELVAVAADPIDDIRGSAAYRRHALAVVARRALGWAWCEYRAAEPESGSA